MRTSQAQAAITRGVAFLQNAQADDGSFATQISRNKRRFVVSEEFVTTFTPALMLQALGSVESARPVCEKLANWLLGQQEKNGAFNYWPKHAPQRQTRPYPNDLDDTACALAGLAAHDAKILDSAQLAKLVRLLLATEQAVGGPYKTWLVAQTTPAVWQDVDLAVNASILYLLQLVAEPLPKLRTLIATVVEKAEIDSSYYSEPMAILYFLARTKPDTATSQRLIDQILKFQKDGFWQSPARAALACTALRRLGFVGDLSAAQAYLLSQQQPDGSWPAATIWLDRKQGKTVYYAGCAELTTALVLEAFEVLGQSSVTPRIKKPDPLVETYSKISALAAGELKKWPTQLRPGATMNLKELQQGDTGRELVLLPHLLAKSLKRPSRQNSEFLTELSLANIFGWLAYTMYDDFLDQDAESLLLPVANTAMRQSLRHFGAARPNDELFRRHVDEAFDRIDAANAWEVAHCRFACDEQVITIGPLPKYPGVIFLAERSIGHSLTPLAVLAQSGISLDCLQAQHFKKGFRHYLAARQLNDDLHDWQDDFRCGQINYVVVRVLEGVKVRTGRHSLAILTPQLERYFWQQALGELCQETTLQLVQCRREFAVSGLLRDDGPLLQLVERLEQSVSRTLDEQTRALEFLKHYTNKNSR